MKLLDPNDTFQIEAASDADLPEDERTVFVCRVLNTDEMTRIADLTDPSVDMKSQKLKFSKSGSGPGSMTVMVARAVIREVLNCPGLEELQRSKQTPVWGGLAVDMVERDQIVKIPFYELARVYDAARNNGVLSGEDAGK